MAFPQQIALASSDPDHTADGGDVQHRDHVPEAAAADVLKADDDRPGEFRPFQRRCTGAR